MIEACDLPPACESDLTADEIYQRISANNPLKMTLMSNHFRHGVSSDSIAAVFDDSLISARKLSVGEKQKAFRRLWDEFEANQQWSA